ncbi:hypothetical protein LX36DRAFT_153165 [Colletotrichum falcatum]|nr:hypothetical protein LX36DRAFT_153165 [Colletotrichum falcatum]
MRLSGRAPRPSSALCGGRPLCLPPTPRLMICHKTASISFASFSLSSAPCRDSLCNMFAAAGCWNYQASSQRHDGICIVSNAAEHMIWRFTDRVGGGRWFSQFDI